MKWAGAIAALSLVLAAGCGSDPPAPPVEDMALARDQRLARLSFQQQRPDQAATLYRQALARAQQRDDLAAIAELGYELAVVQLRRDQAADALAVARSARAEMTRRGSGPPPELLLVEAAALYRTGEGEQADALAAVVAEAPAATGEARSRALFVRGLVAADRSDASWLTDVLAALPPSDEADLRADRAELQGRLHLLQGNWDSARLSLLSGAEARRGALDYSGMARALALTGEASEAAGRRAEAADLYLRAGRAAQLGGNEALARRWLVSARDLALEAGSSDVEGEAARRLSAFDP